MWAVRVNYDEGSMYEDDYRNDETYHFATKEEARKFAKMVYEKDTERIKAQEALGWHEIYPGRKVKVTLNVTTNDSNSTDYTSDYCWGRATEYKDDNYVNMSGTSEDVRLIDVYEEQLDTINDDTLEAAASILEIDM